MLHYKHKIHLTEGRWKYMYLLSEMESRDEKVNYATRRIVWRIDFFLNKSINQLTPAFDFNKNVFLTLHTRLPIIAKKIYSKVIRLDKSY